MAPAPARHWRATASERRKCHMSRLQCRTWTTRPAGTTSPSESTGTTATPSLTGGLRGRSQPGSIELECTRRQCAHGRGDHLGCRRRCARPALGGCRRPGRRRRRAQGRGCGPVTQPVSGRCPRSCGGSKNTVWRSWSWQLSQATWTCPMPRPRPAASRAGSHRHGVQLTCALPGHSW
jgi:hypothetical protein